MIAYCYILYSESPDRFYIGSTIPDAEVRLKRHLDSYYGIIKFTHRAKDWKIFLEIECPTLLIARRVEAYLKRMKSKTYIHNLALYPEMTEKLLFKLSRTKD